MASLFLKDNNEDGASHSLNAKTTSLMYSSHCNPVESIHFSSANRLGEEKRQQHDLLKLTNTVKRH